MTGTRRAGLRWARVSGMWRTTASRVAAARAAAGHAPATRRGRQGLALLATMAGCGGGDRTPTLPREAITITTAQALPGATLGESYDHTLRATGGSGSLEWTVTGGALPAGVELSPGGQLSGTPSAEASHTFTVRAASAAASARADFTLLVARPPLFISTLTLPVATQGVSYSQVLDAVGGEGAITWSLASGALPVGLTLSPAGILAGSASVPGAFAIRVRASRGSLTAERGLLLTVVAPPLVVVTVTLPDAKVGVPYAAQLESTGGRGNNGWSIASGALPAGLTLSAQGTIAGTPSSAGTVALTVAVTSEEQRATRSLALTVDPAGVPGAALVTMPANVFVPFLVQLARGGTVTWRFGAAPHNAVFAPATGAPADIPIVSNVDVARTFPTPGTFRYDCTIHPGMTGVIEVKP